MQSHRMCLDWVYFPQPHNLYVEDLTFRDYVEISSLHKGRSGRPCSNTAASFIKGERGY